MNEKIEAIDAADAILSNTGYMRTHPPPVPRRRIFYTPGAPSAHSAGWMAASGRAVW